MLDLLLAVACSLAIGMIFKHAGQEGLDRITLLTANYAAAALLALVLIALGAKRTAAGLALSPELLALGVGTGVLFIGGFFLLSLATDVAGMSVAVGVMRVSVVIPVLASWLIWREAPTLTQGAGLACAGGAFFMVAARGRADRQGRENVRTEERGGGWAAARTAGVLALLFVTGGLVDTCMKAFDETFAAESSRALFLLMIFGVAFLSGGLVLARRRRRLQGRALAWGAVLGLVNYGSVEFILRAIRALEGPFVFPANNISIVVGAALLGVWFWGERLSALNWAGLAVAALALFLLRP